jgi:hypothetical protein
MNRFIFAFAIFLCALLTGCATSQNVTLAQMSAPRQISSAALVPQEDNAPDMDANLRSALTAQGVTSQAALPAGTRKNADVDALVSYTAVWRWDLVMYLRTLTINISDAATGNLLAMARWDNSAFHGFQDARQVTSDLVAEMFGKLKAGKAQ